MLAATDIQMLSQATGIPPSRVQFLAHEYDDLLKELAGNSGTARASVRAEFLLVLHRLRFTEKRFPEEVRRIARETFLIPRTGARIVAVTSGKGGVGKTTVSLNLAVELQRQGKRTLLVDADLGLANVHVLAGLQPRNTLANVLLAGQDIEEVLMPGPGEIHVVCGASGDTRMTDMPTHGYERLDAELRRVAQRYDVIVLDTGAGIARQVTHFLGGAADILVVTTPNLAATLDAYGIIKVAHLAGIKARQHLLVNQADDAAQALPVYNRIADCAERFLHTRPVYAGHLARDAQVETSHRKRVPVSMLDPDGATARGFHAIAGHLLHVNGTHAAPAPAEVPR